MSSPEFEQALAHTLGLEGPYSNHKNDRGGATSFGVIEATARAYGYKGDMKNYTLADAMPVYWDIWSKLGCQEIVKGSTLIADELFDTAVNCGNTKAVMFLQRALNAFNLRGAHYADIAVDGGMGQGTLLALKAYLTKRAKPGEMVMLKALNSLQAEYYIRICETRPENEDFVFGWINQRVSL